MWDMTFLVKVMAEIIMHVQCCPLFLPNLGMSTTPQRIEESSTFPADFWIDMPSQNSSVQLISNLSTDYHRTWIHYLLHHIRSRLFFSYIYKIYRIFWRWVYLSIRYSHSFQVGRALRLKRIRHISHVLKRLHNKQIWSLTLYIM